MCSTVARPAGSTAIIIAGIPSGGAPVSMNAGATTHSACRIPLPNPHRRSPRTPRPTFTARPIGT
ncbi:MAG: hypothetical protein R3F14_10365 [Polyangiaceae bacterium]